MATKHRTTIGIEREYQSEMNAAFAALHKRLKRASDRRDKQYEAHRKAQAAKEKGK